MGILAIVCGFLCIGMGTVLLFWMEDPSIGPFVGLSPMLCFMGILFLFLGLGLTF